MHLNCLHNEYEKRITKPSVQKKLDGPDDWAEHPSAIIFSFFSFFIQTIVQYLQIKSFSITLSTCNICFVSFFKLIILYISNIQITNLLETYTKRFKVVFFFFNWSQSVKAPKEKSRWCRSILKEQACSSTWNQFSVHQNYLLYYKLISLLNTVTFIKHLLQCLTCELGTKL